MNSCVRKIPWRRDRLPSPVFIASQVAQMVKNLLAMRETWVLSLGWEDPLEGGHGNPFQYSYLENPHGQRSLAGYNPWGHKESDMTEQLSTAQHSIWLPKWR